MKKQGKTKTKSKRTTDRARAMQSAAMKDWSNPADRLEALEKFVAELNAMTTTEVEKFVNSSAKTKTKFAECGPFYEEGKTNPAYPSWASQNGIKKIPKKTKFRVFRNNNQDDFKKRDEEVVLIVNPDGAKDESLADAQTWRCTYSPYVGQPVGHAPYLKARRRAK
jgi:hypothetical protein